MHGVIRRASTFNTGRIDHLYVDPHEPGRPSVSALRRHLRRFSSSHPAQADRARTRSITSVHDRHVRVSFDEPEHTGDTTALGTTGLLEAMRDARSQRPLLPGVDHPRCSVPRRPPERETPASIRVRPYGVAKVYAHWITVNYRESYGLFASTASSSTTRVTAAGRDVRDAQDLGRVARGSSGTAGCLCLGNLDARRDWGSLASTWGDVADVQQEVPRRLRRGHRRDLYSVRDFVPFSLRYVGLD